MDSVGLGKTLRQNLRKNYTHVVELDDGKFNSHPGKLISHDNWKVSVIKLVTRQCVRNFLTQAGPIDCLWE